MEYSQGQLSSYVEPQAPERLKWRLDPDRGGPSVSRDRIEECQERLQALRAVAPQLVLAELGTRVEHTFAEAVARACAAAIVVAARQPATSTQEVPMPSDSNSTVETWPALGGQPGIVTANEWLRAVRPRQARFLL